MIFGGLQRVSTIDFPGVLSCVVFTAGCDLDCFYCHNRALIGTRQGVAEQELKAFLEKRKGLLDGVVVSGGEPTLQPDLAAFLQWLHTLGYKCKLDTNGGRPRTVLSLWQAGLLDYTAVDCKALPEEYLRICGAACFDDVRQTIEGLLALHAPFEVRTTLHPGLELPQLKRLLELFPPVPLWRLNLFQMPALSRPQDARTLAGPALTETQVTDAIEALRQIQPHVTM